jgi:hypothetical protein
VRVAHTRRPAAARAHDPRAQSDHRDYRHPEAGILNKFPAYYEHAVIPLCGPGVRICIAFNANT